ncbi:MAG TPA: hypothetical protein VKW09_14490 [bacterium]|nr:hypothetical protein [bacterium]
MLTILVAITPLIAGHPWRSAVGASSVVPGAGLADVVLGQPIAEVLNRFGTPSAVRLTGTDGLLGYGFDKYGITVYAHGDIVQAVATTNSVVGGVNGIALGTSIAEVVKAMGANYSPATIEGFPGIVYRGAGIAFGMDRDAVASILVFRAAAAAPAQPNTAPAGRPGPFVNPDPGAPGAPAPGGPTATAAAPTAGPDSQSAPALFDVNQLRPFTAAARYLSLSGYMRLLMYRSANTWAASVQETDQHMSEQGNMALR